MRLALAVAAPDGCDARDFFAALEADGVLSAPDVEIRVVVQDAARPLPAVPPGVVVETAGRKSSIFELWGLAVRLATADYVAVLDARCPIESGWLAEVRARLAGNPPALFGPVRCGWPGSSPDIVGYLVEYAHFHQPLAPGLRETPGVNLIVARGLATHPEVLQADGFVKTRLLACLSATGALPLPVEGAAVVYRKRYSFGAYCRHRFRHGRCYGADRGLPPARRLCAALTTPALPPLRTWRIYRACRHARLRGAFFRWLHRILIAETAWSLGELTGYLAGAGASRARLS